MNPITGPVLYCMNELKSNIFSVNYKRLNFLVFKNEPRIEKRAFSSEQGKLSNMP